MGAWKHQPDHWPAFVGPPGDECFAGSAGHYLAGRGLPTYLAATEILQAPRAAARQAWRVRAAEARAFERGIARLRLELGEAGLAPQVVEEAVQIALDDVRERRRTGAEIAAIGPHLPQRRGGP
ncbi:hypothetical protein [Nocardiopsis halophila]|uniref:hypothetical protein n=1 Tax=Nocardiopsis halophila TaxID=141692 RepID=UPI00034D9B81|nr:hypothetical protein [Nocardiopsis halophila]